MILDKMDLCQVFRDEYDYENVQRKLMNSMKNEGYEEGILAGSKNRAIEIARKILSKGIDKKIISECTNLSIEEIDKLLQE